MQANPFQQFVANGYTADLLPILPPNAPLSPYSRLTPQHCGKTPALPTEDGYVGFANWPVVQATPKLIDGWLSGINGSGPCNVGLNARNVHAFDVDTSEREFANAAYAVLEALAPDLLHLTGIRIGRAPGFLVPFRPEHPHRKTRLVFQRGEIKSAVELLGVGQQFVIGGTHAGTGEPYRWRPVRGTATFLDCPAAVLPVLSDARLDAIMAALATKFEQAGFQVLKARGTRLASGPSEHAGPVQSLLAPDFEAVQEALGVLGNSPRNNRTYDDWIAVCHALAGATGKSAEGQELWMSWSQQWDASEGAMAAAERRWASVSLETVGIGWGWLATLAASESETFRHRAAADEFAEPEDDGAAPDDGAAEELFGEPRQDHPTLEEIEGAIDLLEADESASPVLKLIARSRVSFSDRDRLLKRIKGITKIGLTALRHELSNLTRELDHTAEDPHKRVAAVTVAEHFNRLLIRDRDNHFFEYRDDYWQPITSALVRSALNVTTSDHPELLFNAQGKRHSSTDIINGGMARIEDYASALFHKLERNKPREVTIACRNAVITFSGGKVKASQHDYRNFLFGRIEIDYDPRASAPIYDAMLADMMSRSYYSFAPGKHKDIAAEIDAAEVLDEGTKEAPATLSNGMIGWKMGSEYRLVDAADDARMINEIFGYGLLPYRRAQQFVVFTGNGGNGKSRIMELYTKRLVGQVVNTTVDQLQTRFIFRSLANKRVLVIDEGAKNNELRDDILKMLSEDNDNLTVDVKNQEFQSVAVKVLAVINTNNHLYIGDASHGLRRRMVMVTFGRRYEINPDGDPASLILADEAEMSGMLNRWIEGAQRVLARGQIKLSASSINAFNGWMRRNTSEDDFIRAVCTKEKPDGARSQGDMLEDLHQGFLNWYRLEVGNNSTVKAHGKRQFAEVLVKLGFEIYEAEGYQRVRGLWIDPARRQVSADSFAARDFDPITPEL